MFLGSKYLISFGVSMSRGCCYFAMSFPSLLMANWWFGSVVSLDI